MSSLANTIAATILLGLAGCGGEPESTLTGTVTHRGKPLSFALMNFHNQSQGPMAYSMTEEDGSYEVLTGSQSGLKPGKYKLAFESRPDDALSVKYKTIETSGLEYEIKDGQNIIDITLE